MTRIGQTYGPGDEVVGVMSFADSGRQVRSEKIVAILLAAGRSQRMGGRNKLLMDVEGQPMVRRVAATLLASRVEQVIAVLGHDRALVAAALAGLPLRIVVNAQHGSGQMSSVRAGIAAIADDPAAIVVALADQPALRPADIDFLIDAFLALRGAGSWCRSTAGSAATRSCCPACSSGAAWRAASTSAAAT